jgi:hypothetical protein
MQIRYICIVSPTGAYEQIFPQVYCPATKRCLLHLHLHRHHQHNQFHRATIFRNLLHVHRPRTSIYLPIGCLPSHHGPQLFQHMGHRCNHLATTMLCPKMRQSKLIANSNSRCSQDRKACQRRMVDGKRHNKDRQGSPFNRDSSRTILVAVLDRRTSVYRLTHF